MLKLNEIKINEHIQLKYSEIKCHDKQNSTPSDVGTTV